jgi:hypothetical protein
LLFITRHKRNKKKTGKIMFGYVCRGFSLLFQNKIIFSFVFFVLQFYKSKNHIKIIIIMKLKNSNLIKFLKILFKYFPPFMWMEVWIVKIYYIESLHLTKGSHREWVLFSIECFDYQKCENQCFFLYNLGLKKIQRVRKSDLNIHQIYTAWHGS